MKHHMAENKPGKYRSNQEKFGEAENKELHKKCLCNPNYRGCFFHNHNTTCHMDGLQLRMLERLGVILLAPPWAYPSIHILQCSRNSLASTTPSPPPPPKK